MEFLINIKIKWDSDVSPETRRELRDKERERAAVLASEGKLLRMWRVPGRLENWGLWRAKDPTELHEILTSLPVWPYMTIDVHSLGKHPVDPASY